jgi:hypothetical protein
MASFIAAVKAGACRGAYYPNYRAAIAGNTKVGAGDGDGDRKQEERT